MLYKPNFCCQCGEKIDRIEWKLFTSRRFCEYCEAENSFQDRLPKAFTVIALAVGILGVGGYLKNDSKTLNVTKASKAEEPRPLAKIENKKSSLDNSAQVAEKADLMEDRPFKETGTENSKDIIANKKVFAEGSPKDAQEQLFTCGARTKKGTACSRTVKGNVRCWQHTGLPAMLSKEELMRVK